MTESTADVATQHNGSSDPPPDPPPMADPPPGLPPGPRVAAPGELAEANQLTLPQTFVEQTLIGAQLDPTLQQILSELFRHKTWIAHYQTQLVIARKRIAELTPKPEA